MDPEGIMQVLSNPDSRPSRKNPWEKYLILPFLRGFHWVRVIKGDILKPVDKNHSLFYIFKDNQPVCIFNTLNQREI